MQWISIESKLPNAGREVIVADNLDDIWMAACYIENGELVWKDSWGDELGVVTHWMPLPDAPGR